MESTDEKIAKKMRQVREAEAKEKAKTLQKEISKKRAKAIAEGKNPDEVKKEDALKMTIREESKREISKPEAKPLIKPTATKGKGMSLGAVSANKTDFIK